MCLYSIYIIGEFHQKDVCGSVQFFCYALDFEFNIMYIFFEQSSHLRIQLIIVCAKLQEIFILKLVSWPIQITPKLRWEGLIKKNVEIVVNKQQSCVHVIDYHLLLDNIISDNNRGVSFPIDLKAFWEYISTSLNCKPFSTKRKLAMSR